MTASPKPPQSSSPSWEDLSALLHKYAEEYSGTMSQRQSYVAAASLLEVYYGIDAISAFKIDLNALDDTPPPRRVAPKPVETAPKVVDPAAEKPTRVIPVRPPYKPKPSMGGKSFAIYLDQASVDIAIELGDGNLSAGIRAGMKLAAVAKRGQE